MPQAPQENLYEKANKVVGQAKEGRKLVEIVLTDDAEWNENNPGLPSDVLFSTDDIARVTREGVEILCDIEGEENELIPFYDVVDISVCEPVNPDDVEFCDEDVVE